MIENNESQRGRFITVEGTEGVGKSTNIAFIKHYLEAAGIELVLTREPGGTELAEQIRQILLDPREEKMSDDAELLLMFASRAQHINALIEPALAQGKWVLSDRFTDATYAYQGAGRGVSIERIAQLEQFVQGELRPDLTFLLDAPVDIGLQRALARSAPDRIEQEKISFFENVRRGYHQQMDKEPYRFSLIDAQQNLASVQSQIERRLQRELSK